MPYRKINPHSRFFFFFFLGIFDYLFKSVNVLFLNYTKIYDCCLLDFHFKCFVRVNVIIVLFHGTLFDLVSLRSEREIFDVL